MNAHGKTFVIAAPIASKVFNVKHLQLNKKLRKPQKFSASMFYRMQYHVYHIRTMTPHIHMMNV